MTASDNGEPTPRKVHVSELLAAYGRTVEPSGRRRRRAEPVLDSAVLDSAVLDSVVLAEFATPVRHGAASNEPADQQPDVGRTAPPLAVEPPVERPSEAPAELTPVKLVPEDAAPAELTPGAESSAGPAERSPGQEWALVGVQLVGALAGGAGLWFAFRWLWDWHSVVALVLSAIVIVGLVVIVRVLRRAEDLFSTVLAVLAGLIITVSPPVLTLTGR